MPSYTEAAERPGRSRRAGGSGVMGRGEGFGGAPLATMTDSMAGACREAVRDGMLGVVVDPVSVVSGIRDALGREKRLQDGLGHFSHERFVPR